MHDYMSFALFMIATWIGFAAIMIAASGLPNFAVSLFFGITGGFFMAMTIDRKTIWKQRNDDD